MKIKILDEAQDDLIQGFRSYESLITLRARDALHVISPRTLLNEVE